MMAEAGALVIQALAMEHSMTLLLMVMRLSLSLQKEYMALLMEVEVGVAVIQGLLAEIFSPFQLMVQSS